MELEGMQCCGVNEIHELSYTLAHTTVEKVVLGLTKQVMGKDGSKYDGDFTCAFLMFTGISPYKASNRLKDFIEKHGLGDVTETPIHRNPNSGNNLKCYIWGLNHLALHQWRKEYERNIEEGERVPRHQPRLR